MKSKVTGRLKKIFIILMCMTLAVCPVMTETVSAANVKTSNTTVKKKLSGWVKVQRGQVRYYRSGRYFKGCRRIGRNYYYFNANGILMKKDTTVRGVRYYIEDNGRVLGLKKGSQYYAPNGKRLGKDQATELRAYQNARKIVAQITNNKMTQEQKLKTCFLWVRRNSYGTRGSLGYGGDVWYAANANQIFERKIGNCVPFACAMAYMAKVIGYRNVYLCSAGTREDDYHTWTEINGRVYDVFGAKRWGVNEYYGVNYNRFKFTRVYKQKTAESKQIARQLCSALWVFHSMGMVHRDVKPDNVIIRGKEAVLIDFDASRIYKSTIQEDTQILGTTGFAAPEQYGLSQSDGRADIYALGVLLNIMLTGEHPSRKLAGGRMGRIVQRCTMVNPAKRYKNILHLMEVL